MELKYEGCRLILDYKGLRGESSLHTYGEVFKIREAFELINTFNKFQGGVVYLMIVTVKDDLHYKEVIVEDDGGVMDGYFWDTEDADLEIRYELREFASYEEAYAAALCNREDSHLCYK